MIGIDLSGYEILELAGSGGMGEVYRARDRQLGRTVAIKVVRPDDAHDRRLGRRLLREARTYAALQHPGIVAVHSVGSEQGVDFIVMEWVSGHTLAAELARGPLPIDRVVELSVHLADALAAAHAAGIVHRDLKPHNVMIDERGLPKLVDFGIAKIDAAVATTVIGDTGGEQTAAGHAPGTLAYMSPEQALGESVDERSDVFSLGVLLYEMLAGERPFRGETQGALIRQLLFAPPEPLTARRPGLTRELEAVTLRALAKKPEERQARMSELSSELRALQLPSTLSQFPSTPSNGRPPAQHPSPPWHRWRALPARRRAAAAASAALLGTLLVAAAAVLVSGREPSLRGAGWLGEEGAAHAGTGPASGETGELPSTPYQLYREGMRLLARFDRDGYTDAALVRFEAAVERSPEYAPAHVGLATASWRHFRAKRDPVWLRRAEESARRALELDPLLLDAQLASARIAAMEGDRDGIRASLAELRRLHPGEADVVAVLAEIAFYDGDPALAAELYRRALALRPEDWELHAELGKVEAAAGDLDAAEAAFRDTLALVPDSAIARRNLGAVLHYQGRYAEAVRELQAAVTIQPAASTYSNLGTAYYFQGAYREAVSAFEAARELGANNYLLWGNLGDAYRQVPGQRAEAAACFERALQLLDAEIDTVAPDATRRSRRASYLAKAGRTEEAVAEIERLEPLTERGGDVAFRAMIVYELAGSRARALSALEAALATGYPVVEIANEPELTALREDVAFHRAMAGPDRPTGARDVR